MNRRKRSLQQAFVVTVATSAAMAFAGGCNGANNSFFDDEETVISNPPFPEGCPDNQPGYNDGCSEIGLSCSYGGSDPCDEVWAECTEDGWQTYQTSCNPPPAFCPDALPEIGTLCEPQYDSYETYPSWCQYPLETPCGESYQVLGCEWLEDGSAMWVQLEEPPACEIAPQDCHNLVDEAQCGATSSCQWLLPGCFDEGGEQGIEVGCYPVGDCSVSGCGSWGSCVTGVYDPCYGLDCGFCGAEINVCMPAPE